MPAFLPFFSVAFEQSRRVPASAALLIFFLAGSAVSQPDFTVDELNFIRAKKNYSAAIKYRLPQDKFPMPPISDQNTAQFADGDIDPTFNASVSEGFGYVNETVAQTDGKIIVVGLFQRANGTRTNGIARFNADGTLDTSFNSGAGANGAIRAVALQTDGKIIIGGAFTSFNNQSVNRIVRLNSDGSIDSSFSVSVVFSNQINDIAILSSGKIMVGGSFNLSSTRLARLNSNGTLDSVIPGFSSAVWSIAIGPDGKILVGGQFSLPEPNVARLNSDGSFDATFDPTTGGAGFPVYKVKVQPDNKVIAAGSFTDFNGVQTDGVVRLNVNGSVDSTFVITIDPGVTDLEVDGLAIQPDGKILVSYFNNSGVLIADVRRFNSDASVDTTFNTNTDNSLAAVDLNLLGDGSILAGGYFVTVNNQQRLRLVKLSSNGTLDTSFSTALSTTGTVFAIKRQFDGKTIIGGDFEYVNGARKRALARLNADGSLDSSFTIGDGFTGDVYAIEVQPDNKVLIGGLFSGNTNFPSYAATRLNSEGSFDTDLNSTANFIFVAYGLALQPDGRILVAGQIFEQTFTNALAASRLNSNGSLDTSFTPAFITNGTARTILLQPSGKIIVGGTFFSAGGTTMPRNGILRLDTNGALDAAFSSSTGNVYSLKRQPDGQVFAGGFTLTRFSSEGVPDPTLNVGSGFNSLIRTVAVQPDGKVIAGGFFTSYNGNSVGRICRINANGAIDSTLAASAAGTVFAVDLQPDGKATVGGQFVDFNGTEKFSIVRLQNSAARRPALFDFDGDFRTDIGIFRPAPGEWWYLRSSDNSNRAFQFGQSTDKIVAADYTGDGKTDIGFYRPASGDWFILRSEDSSFYSFPFGNSSDVPAPADFDGDGKADPAIYRPANSTWYIIRSSDSGTTIAQFGAAGDQPVAADYDGDGKADLAIFRPADGSWWLNRSQAGLIVTNFGTSSDKNVQADYTGDGKADVAFFRPSTNEWFVLRSEDFSFYSAPFGASGDVPVPGDYDGDGKSDLAIFRPSSSTWYLLRSASGFVAITFGAANDVPVPSAYVR